MEMEMEDNQNLEETNDNDNGSNILNPNKPSSPNFSDDDSDDDDAEDESHLTEELKTLETELSNNPSNYDAHVQYIKLLRKMDEVVKLNQAREAMSTLFPLTPVMWQEWAKDEAALSSKPEAFLAIEKLYERGVLDYLSVPLWCDYLNYLQEYDSSVRECTSDGISKARNLFERALTAAGLHVAEGNKIWEAYREFESAILFTIDETDIKAKEAQIQRIRNIFHRQSSVPLYDMRSTLLAYKAWEVEQGNVLDAESTDLDGISAHVASAYQKALEMYNARVQHEENISKKDISDAEKIQNFMNYLRFEESVGDPARVQILYERAITEFPISKDLWLDYTQYLDRTLKIGNIIRDVYSRATKNYPWIGELWVRYLLSMERGRASEKEIAAVFEKSMQCTFSTYEEYLDLFLTRIDGLRRRIVSGREAEGVLDYSLIRETFQSASDYLSPQLKSTDGMLKLYAYWARLELKLGKDLVAARGVWESLLKISGTMFEAWQGYLAMEIELDHISEARSIYKRCYSKRFAGTGSEDICHSWLRFEREFGTLEDFDYAMQKVTPRLAELQLYRIQQESKALSGSTDQRENPSKKGAREKRKGGSSATDEQSPAKRQKQEAQAQSKRSEKEKGQAENPTEVNETEEIKAEFDKADNTDEKQKAHLDTGKPKVYKDQCTAFISNLDYKANDRDIQKFFADVGGVVSIRILHDRLTGKSRGLAYVDFSDEEHLKAAIAKNKEKLLGKKLAIARSNPKQGKKESRGIPKERVHGSDQSGRRGGSASKESAETSNQDDNIQLKGKNTFAVPRKVKPLGFITNKPSNIGDGGGDGEEKPKSNDEFRKMFIKN